jgi:hypothetical protein
MITTGLSTSLTRYNPYFCIGVVLLILFILWVFYGGKKYDFIGLAPLDPVTHLDYTGSLYSWGNSTPSNNSTSSNNEISPDNPINNSIEPNSVIDQNNAPVPVDSLRDISVAESSNPVSGVSGVFGVSEPVIIENEIIRVPDPLYQNVCPHSSPKICVSENKLLIDETPALPLQFVKDLKEVKNLKEIKNLNNRDKRLPSKGERICCQTMERIYGVPFKSTWPSWLRNPETGAEMELDCFNDDLKIAVEYNGVQHYQWPNYTNQSYEQFMNQVRRDDLKKRICDRHGVYLITVPYNVPYEQIPEYITLYLPETIKKRIHEEHALEDIKRYA